MTEDTTSYRPLSDWERRIILRLLLSSPFPGRDALLAQLETAVAQSLDEDGTVALKCPNAPKAEIKPRIPVEAKGVDTDGVTIHYLLHVWYGEMNELEVYKDDGSRVVKHPEIEDLTVMVV